MLKIHVRNLVSLTLALATVVAVAQKASPLQPPAQRGAGPAVSSRDRVYTGDQTSNTVTVIDPSTNTALGQIRLGHPRPRVLGALDDKQVNVHGLGFSPDGRYLNVVSTASNGVTIVRTADNKVMGTVYLGRGPHEGFFTPDGRQVWVTVRGEDYLSVIDVAGLREVGRVKVANGPGMVVFRPDGRYAFVNSSRTPVFEVVDVRTRRVVARTRVVSPFSPNLVATPDGKDVWITHKDVGKVTRIDARTFKVMNVLDTGMTTNHVNAVSTKDGDFIYVTVGGEDAVKVIKRGPRPEVVATIKTGPTPHGIWPSADNTRVFVGLEDGDAVDVIATATNKVIKTIRIGQAPQGLVYVANAVPSGEGKGNLETIRLGLPAVKFKLGVPNKPFDFLPAALAKANGSVVVRRLEGTDELMLKVQGLPANAEYVVFLTETATAPFGALQYLLDFKTDKDGKAEASAQAVVFDAIALRGSASGGKPDVEAIRETKVDLDHLVVWPADPKTTAGLFQDRGEAPAVSPFDSDLEAGPAVLSDSNDPGARSPLDR